MDEIKISKRGNGFVIASQEPGNKQLSSPEIEELVDDLMHLNTGVKKSYKLLKVNNTTDSMKINQLMREYKPDARVYTLLQESKIKRTKP